MYTFVFLYKIILKKEVKNTRNKIVNKPYFVTFIYTELHNYNKVHNIIIL